MSWRKWMPELQWISDPSLRERTIDVLAEGARRGGWEQPITMAYVEETASGTPPVVRQALTLIQHLRLVAAAAGDMAKHCNQIVAAQVNIDYVIAGALLHDVGLFELFAPTESGPVLRGPLLLRHPFVGARLANELGMPEEIVHIVATHSVEGESIQRTAEAALVHWADWATYDVMRETLFPWVPQERAFYYYAYYPATSEGLTT